MCLIKIKKYWEIVNKFGRNLKGWCEKNDKLINLFFVIIFGFSSIMFGCSSYNYSKKQDEFIKFQKSEEAAKENHLYFIKQTLLINITRNLYFYSSQHFENLHQQNIGKPLYRGETGIFSQINLTDLKGVDPTTMFWISTFYDQIRISNEYFDRLFENRNSKGNAATEEILIKNLRGYNLRIIHIGSTLLRNFQEEIEKHDNEDTIFDLTIPYINSVSKISPSSTIDNINDYKWDKLEEFTKINKKDE